MVITFTNHAKLQLVERKISKLFVISSVKHPTLVKKQIDGRFQFLKLFKHQQKTFLLVSIIEKTPNNIIIVTIFKTSKIKKYL